MNLGVNHFRQIIGCSVARTHKSARLIAHVQQPQFQFYKTSILGDQDKFNKNKHFYQLQSNKHVCNGKHLYAH